MFERITFFTLLFIIAVIRIQHVDSLIVSTLFGSAVFARYWGGWDFMKDHTYCRVAECCNTDYVAYDMNKLRTSLSQKMFGQPFVDELVNIISAHKEAVNDNIIQNKKPLVISLNGMPGVVVYAASMIAESVYKNGMKSKYVHLFKGKIDFDCEDIKESKKQLVSKVYETVKKCPRSLLIFDSIHEMCPSVLEYIKPMLGYHHAVDGVDFRDSIFIFISPIGGYDIESNLLDLYSQGIMRNDVEFQNFEAIIRGKAYFAGSFEKAALIAQHLIDHYIPFLPLEQQHVEMCVLSELRSYGIYHPSKEMKAHILSVITYGPSDQPIFANNGCKGFRKHVPYIIYKYKKEDEL